LDLSVLHGRLAIGTEEYQLQHLSFLEAAQFLSPTWLEQCFSFTVCRNPWDRLVSTFNWQGAQGSFRDFAQWASETVATGRELAGRNCHLRPQIDFIDTRLSFLGRFETLATDVQHIFAEIGLPSIELARSGATGRGHYADYYDDYTRDLVRRTYEADLDFFKYVF
jgi:hypothetical protein